MTNDDQTTPRYLFDFLIEKLELSQKATYALKRYGITNIGDCLDHFARVKSGNEMLVRGDFLEVMHTEVLDNLVQHGYMTQQEASKYRS